MEENIEKIIRRIENKEATIKTEIVPVMEEMVTIDGLPFRKYDLLGIACKLIDNNNLDEAENLLKMVEGMYSNKFDSETFNRICSSLYDLIIYEENKKDELYYQEIFKAHCKEILGDDYNIYDMKKLQPKRPDAWVKYNEIIMPVEMKMGNFNYSALKQLQEYMKLYKCLYGIAIGSKTTIDLPDNIKFVEIERVKQYDN